MSSMNCMQPSTIKSLPDVYLDLGVTLMAPRKSFEDPVRQTMRWVTRPRMEHHANRIQVGQSMSDIKR